MATRMSPAHLGHTSFLTPSCSIQDGDLSAEWGVTTHSAGEKVIAARSRPSPRSDTRRTRSLYWELMALLPSGGSLRKRPTHSEM